MVRFKVSLNFLSWPSRRGVLFNTRNVVASGTRLIVSVSDADVPKNVPKHKTLTSGGVCKSLIYKAEGRGFEPRSARARRFSRPLPYQLGLALPIR